MFAYNEWKTETHEGISLFLVVEDHSMSRQVETSLFVATVKSVDVSRTRKRHRHIVAK